MLESASERLSQRGGPHFGSPDKHAGAAARDDRGGRRGGGAVHLGHPDRHRRDARASASRRCWRCAICMSATATSRKSSSRISAPSPTPGWRTRPSPIEADHLWTIAVARLVFGAGDEHPGAAQSDAGRARSDDRGRDQRLGRRVAGDPRPRQPRSAVADARPAGASAPPRPASCWSSGWRSIPNTRCDPARWLDPALRTPTLRAIDGAGPRAHRPLDRPAPAPQPDPLARGRERASRVPASSSARARCEPNPRPRDGRRDPGRSATSSACSRRAATSSTRSARPPTGCAAQVNGDTVSYVVTRNINYTNICYFRCQFCAFSKGKLSENLRGRPYDLDLDEIVRRCEEAWERGATEVCLQGGIHPEYTGATYLGVCRAIKQAVPGHAYPRLLAARNLAGRQDARAAPSPISSPNCATPGSARCPAPRPKSSTTRCARSSARTRSRPPNGSRSWRRRTASACAATVTIMFGHVDRYEHWARHLLRVRALQAAHRRLHRIRAAALCADGSADLAEGPRAARPDLSRGGADARGRRGSRCTR